MDHLEHNGGVGFTIEDPVEYDLTGRHGERDFCPQTKVRHDHEWAEALINSLSCHPRYIFYWRGLHTGYCQSAFTRRNLGPYGYCDPPCGQHL